jgi:hypothetical protein
MLELSKEHPLTIRFDCNLEDTLRFLEAGPELRSTSQLLRLLGTHAHRWRALITNFRSTKVAKLAFLDLLKVPTPKLEYLSVGLIPTLSTALVPFGIQPQPVPNLPTFIEPLRAKVLPNAPKLATLRCSNLDTLHCIAEIANLRELQLYNHQLDIAFNYANFISMLRTATQLSNLALIGVLFHDWKENDAPPSIYLPSVTSFSYTLTEQKPGTLDPIKLLHLIDVPNLESLSLGNYTKSSQNSGQSAIFTTLLTYGRNPPFPQLRELRLSGTIEASEIISHHFLFPNIESLILGPEIQGLLLLHKLRTIDSHTTSKYEDISSPLVWPRLTRLVVYDAKAEDIACFLKQRRASSPLVNGIIAGDAGNDEDKMNKLNSPTRVFHFPSIDSLNPSQAREWWSLDEPNAYPQISDMLY